MSLGGIGTFQVGQEKEQGTGLLDFSKAREMIWLIMALTLLTFKSPLDLFLSNYSLIDARK